MSRHVVGAKTLLVGGIKCRVHLNWESCEPFLQSSELSVYSVLLQIFATVGAGHELKWLSRSALKKL